jgi:uncharacterized cupin superfamily protein
MTIGEFEQRQLSAKDTNEQLTLIKALAAAFSLTGIPVHHETLPSGTKSSPAHHYAKKGEMIFVLKGSPSVRMNGEIAKLNPGEVFGFPVGEEVSFVIVNESDVPAHFLSIRSNPNENEAIYA